MTDIRDLDSILLDGWSVAVTWSRSYRDLEPYVVALRRTDPLRSIIGNGDTLEAAIVEAARQIRE